MGTDRLKELKRFQKEIDGLRKAVSGLTPDKLILTEAARAVKGVSGTVRETVPALNGRSP